MKPFAQKKARFWAYFSHITTYSKEASRKHAKQNYLKISMFI